MKTIARICSDSIFTGNPDFQDVLLPSNAFIENFGFKENEILSVSARKTEVEETKRVALKAQYISRSLKMHPRTSARDETIYYFVFCKFQVEEGFTYSDFAEALNELIKKRCENGEGVLFSR